MTGPDQLAENTLGVHQIGGIIRFRNALQGRPDQISRHPCALTMCDKGGSAECDPQPQHRHLLLFCQRGCLFETTVRIV